MMFLRMLIILAAGLCLLNPGLGLAKSAPKRPSLEHKVYFPNTPDELNVYRVYGAQDGKTMMIMGGIQGNEPGGFLTADQYADISLAKGNLIVVPRANFYSIILNHRGPDGDMNRQFGDPVTAKRQKKIVSILKKLIRDSDLLLNLHDGSGFYRPKWEGPWANPKRYGQSLIADTDHYVTEDGRAIDLKRMAQRVLDKVNPHIINPKYRLLFNNHRTSSKDSLHKEQRRSATYYALTKRNIPAFGVETSKSLPSTDLKVRHHTLVVNAFMQELGIIPQTPYPAMQRPVLKFVVIGVSGRPPQVLGKGEKLLVAPGDNVKVLHIESNYERGLTCDFVGLGSVNDLRQSFVIQKNTQLVVRKDNVKIGTLSVELSGKPQVAAERVHSPILYFLVETGGTRQVLANRESLKLVKGDQLVLVDVLTNLPNQRDIKVNFKGFVPRGQPGNQGEDRGFKINTARDLLLRYSECRPGADKQTECYRVVAQKGGRKLGEIMVEVVPARLEYLVLKRENGHDLVYHQGETVRAKPGELLQVVDLKTNINNSQKELELSLSSGESGKTGLTKLYKGLIDTSRLSGNGKGKLRLVVMRAGRAIGHVQLAIGEN